MIVQKKLGGEQARFTYAAGIFQLSDDLVGKHLSV
jgi:hypothetical protein